MGTNKDQNKSLAFAQNNNNELLKTFLKNLKLIRKLISKTNKKTNKQLIRKLFFFCYNKHSNLMFEIILTILFWKQIC